MNMKNMGILDFYLKIYGGSDKFDNRCPNQMYIEIDTRVDLLDSRN